MAPRPTTKPADTDATPDETTPAVDTDTSAEAADVKSDEPTPAEQKPTDLTRIEIVQAPAEPAVYYGDGGVQPEQREHVKAEYTPFEW